MSNLQKKCRSSNPTKRNAVLIGSEFTFHERKINLGKKEFQSNLTLPYGH
jgi:hypothetical protein